MLQRVRFGRTGLVVTKLAFGGIPIQRVSRQDGIRLVKDALELGINFIDTAHGYGHSEELIGEAIQTVRRDSVVIATKSPAADRKTLLSDLDESLRRLRTDHIDIFQLHNVASSEKMAAVMASRGAFEGLKEVIPLAQQADMGVIAMKPLGGGLLEDARLCFRYLLQFPGVVPDPGIETLPQLREILEVVESSGPLTAEKIKRTEQHRIRLGKEWCHRCDYCQPCPQHIPISTVLIAKSFARRMPTEKAQSFVAVGFKAAENCEECSECVQRCPYHLEIPALLKRQRDLWDVFLKTGTWA